jgi:phospholipase C
LLGSPRSGRVRDKGEFANSTFWKSAPHAASNQGMCNSWHAIGTALGGTGQYGYNNELSLNQNPFQFYASTANPHHLTIPIDGAGDDTLGGLTTIGRDTQSYVEGRPQFDTPNHQYDMSDFDQLVAAINNGDLPPSVIPPLASSKRLRTRPATRPTPTRPTSSSSWFASSTRSSRPRTGRTPR